MSTLAGKTILMSGGSRGIGLAIALRAARDGANIALMAKTDSPHPKLEGTVFTAADEMARIWQVRKAGLPLLLGLPGDKKPVAFIEDTAVDPDRLVEYVDRFDEIVRRHGTTAAWAGP